MHYEQIQIGPEAKRADQVVVPDICYIGIMVAGDEQELLEFAYRSAIRIYMFILTRQRNRHACKKRFAIDIPDLWCIAKKLRQQERDELVRFMVAFQGLVNHLLPKAQAECYTCDGENLAGVRYTGMAWVSEV